MQNGRTTRVFVAACMMLVQGAFPCLVVAQAIPGGAGGRAPSVAQAVGFVSSISGRVMIRRGSGAFEPARPGDLFGPGTVFNTGSEGSIAIVFSDGQNVTLSKDSLLRIDDFQYDSRNMKSSRATLGLAAGMMRLVTGAIHTQNPSGLSVLAGSAVVEILSKDTTAFVLEVDPKSQDLGSAAAIVGEIAIDTPVGTAVRVSSDQFTRWQKGAAPTAPAPLAAAPAVFQAAVAASRATVSGSNLPIDIQSAAFQAALATFPPTAAGQVQAQAELPAAELLPAVTPGGGGGCVGSPC